LVYVLEYVGHPTDANKFLQYVNDVIKSRQSPAPESVCNAERGGAMYAIGYVVA